MSRHYTGMIDVFALDNKDDDPIGRWYSHPLVAECRGAEPLGNVRHDGSRCTWKQRKVARVMRGWQLYAAGLNASGLNCDPSAGVGESCAPNAAQITYNMRIMDIVMASAPLQPWSCA